MNSLLQTDSAPLSTHISPCYPREYPNNSMGYHILYPRNGFAQEGLRTVPSLPYPAPPHGPVTLSDEEIFHLSNKWLEDERIGLSFSALYDEVAPVTPVVAQSVEALSRETYNMSYIFPHIEPRIYYEKESLGDPQLQQQLLGNEGQNPSSTTQPVIHVAPSYYEGKKVFTCTECRRVYDRVTRARDCANQDLGLNPYQCGGACGDTKCTVTYSSQELWWRHLVPSKKCPLCQKVMARQNVARHREFHCPSRQSMMLKSKV